MSLLAMICIAGCQNSPYADKIPGTWSAVEWRVNGQPGQYNVAGTRFSFDQDGRYTYTYGSEVEEGSYFLSRDELITTPDGGIKMMVRIERMSGDTLVFNMNRGGSAERIVLIRQ